MVSSHDYQVSTHLTFYLTVSSFKPQHDDRLSLASSVPLEKYWRARLIRSRTVPAISFPSQYSLVTTALDAIQTALLPDSLNVGLRPEQFPLTSVLLTVVTQRFTEPLCAPFAEICAYQVDSHQFIRPLVQRTSEACLNAQQVSLQSA